MLAVIGSGATDRGRIRERNEDSFALGDLDRERLFDGEGALTAAGPRGLCAIVCDGMGGAAGGDVASELAARATWRELVADHATDDPEVFARLLRRAVRVANQRVYDEAEREPSLRGMGTTLSAVGVAGGRLVCAQVGDSRVFCGAHPSTSGGTIRPVRSRSWHCWRSQSSCLRPAWRPTTISAATGSKRPMRSART